jgi:hypothetical protein
VIEDPLVKIGAATAAEVCASFDLSSDARPLLLEGMGPREFLAALMERSCHVDAIVFLAHSLPVREAIWWGCLCMQHALGDRLSPVDRAAATAALRWVFDPAEENRAVAGMTAGAAPPPSIAGALATAAFHSGGNISPPSLPPRAPAPFASAKAIALAVKLCAVKAPPAKIVATQRSYGELGLEIAAGRLV